MIILWQILPILSALYYGVKCQVAKVRGGLIPIEKHPYVVSVQEKSNHKCNGVILTKKFVLTSGHCLDKHLNSYTVLAAADDLSATFEAKRLPIGFFKGHTEPEYDLGLMQLKEPLNFTEEIQPIKLPKNLAKLPDWGYLVGFGSYRISKFKDRLRAIKVARKENTTACDKDNELEFCVGTYTGTDKEALPDDPNKEAAKDPAWLQKDKEDPWEWGGGKRVGANRRAVDMLEKSIEKLEDMGEGIMNEFALGTPFVRDGVLYGFITRKDGEVGILTSIPQFVKYIKSNVFDFTERRR